VLLEFEYFSVGIYDMAWLNSEDPNDKLSGLATYSDRILTRSTANNETEELKLLKTYPNKVVQFGKETIST